MNLSTKLTHFVYSHRRIEQTATMQHQIPAGYDFAPKADGFALTTDMSDSSSRPLSTSMSGKTQTVGPYGQGEFASARHVSIHCNRPARRHDRRRLRFSVAAAVAHVFALYTTVLTVGAT
jgi:hypothetical protein